MLKRKKFIKSAGTVAAGFLLLPGLQAWPIFYHSILDGLSVGLFTLPKMMENNFASAMKMIAGIGYKEVELSGPYSFIAAEDIERWKSVTPLPGFSGSGFFGLTAGEGKKYLQQTTLACLLFIPGWLRLKLKWVKWQKLQRYWTLNM